MCHPKRPEDVLLHVLLEGLSAGALHDVACQAHTVIGISRNYARRINAHGLVRDYIIAQRDCLFRVGNDDVVKRLFKTRRVRHQVAQGDGLVEGGTDLEVEILIYVRVEIKLALLFQLHHRDPGEELGDRGEAEDSRRWIDGLLRFDVSVTVSLLQQNVAVLHDEHGGAGDVAALKLQGENAIEKCCEVGLVERGGGGGCAGTGFHGLRFSERAGRRGWFYCRTWGKNSQPRNHCCDSECRACESAHENISNRQRVLRCTRLRRVRGSAGMKWKFFWSFVIPLNGDGITVLGERDEFQASA